MGVLLSNLHPISEKEISLEMFKPTKDRFRRPGLGPARTNNNGLFLSSACWPQRVFVKRYKNPRVAFCWMSVRRAGRPQQAGHRMEQTGGRGAAEDTPTSTRAGRKDTGVSGGAVGGDVNPGAVGASLQARRMRGGMVAGGQEGPSSWIRVLHSSCPEVSAQRMMVRALITLCVLGLLGGVVSGVWFIVKLLLKPTSANSPAGLGDTKDTPFCNVSEDTSVTERRRVFYRISDENSLLEIRLEKLRWVPVCYERWNSSLGTLVCRQLGYLRLTNHKGVNLTDIGPNYTDGFVQITSEHRSTLEGLWQFRDSCSTGKVIALKCFECGRRVKPARIIGGVAATPGRWPWQVGLYHNSRHTCGGSIISGQWVLTAAHCVHELLHASRLLVYAGTITRNLAKLDERPGYAVEKIIYNKNYNHRSHDNDIALVKLRTPLNFSDTIRPVCLPQYNHEFPGGTQCWISGWGYTHPDNVHIPDTLKEAPVPLISSKTCNSSCMYNGEVTPRMLCAGYAEGKVDACQGDSGGPLVCQDDDVWRLVGVVSWGTGCAEPNHPGVYTKVAEFLGWIFETIETN
ncbi:transmembrane protease serine 5 isoform X2 [Brachyhypopomus gauderio]|uniref:transmembrane protease serine 5 isoform X2 n=1 Tax=Brachyhypopomus gauderio TaxID=698409 RepID=UPI00404257E0